MLYPYNDAPAVFRFRVDVFLDAIRGSVEVHGQAKFITNSPTQEELASTYKLNIADIPNI